MKDIEIKANDTGDYATIKINGKEIPHVFSYNIKHDIINEVPVIDLEISGNSIFFEGEAEVNIEDVTCGDKEMAQQMHDILEEKYDLD